MSVVTILHFSALRSEARACVAVLAAALVLAPVAHAPTSPVNLVLALVFAFLICLFSWIFRCGYRVLLSGARLFSRVSTSDDAMEGMSTRSSSSIGGAGGGDGRTGSDIEMSRSKGRVSLQRESEVEDRGLLDESVHAGESERTQSLPDRDRYREREREGNMSSGGCSSHAFTYIFIGVVLAIIGFSSFAFESRTNYWIVHSIWHFTAFGSTYFLIKGRHLLFDKLCFDLS